MNTLILVDDITANREKWLETRKHKITSSVAPTLAKLNPYKSVLLEWCEWTGRTVDAFEGNDFTRLGETLEPYVAELWRHENKLPEDRLVHANALYGHKELSWAAASPDYLVTTDTGETEILEIKTATQRRINDWSLEPPLYVRIQLHWQMGVMGINRGHIACLVGGDPRQLYCYSYEFAPEIWDQLVGIGKNFLDMVKNDLPPEPGSGDSDLVRLLSEESNKDMTQVSLEEEDKVLELLKGIDERKRVQATVNAQLKELDKERKTLENKLRMLIGTPSRAILPCGAEIHQRRVIVSERLNPAYSYFTMKFKNLEAA